MVKNGSRSPYRGNPMYNKKGKIRDIKGKAFSVDFSSFLEDRNI